MNESYDVFNLSVNYPNLENYTGKCLMSSIKTSKLPRQQLTSKSNIGTHNLYFNTLIFSFSNDIVLFHSPDSYIISNEVYLY